MYIIAALVKREDKILLKQAPETKFLIEERSVQNSLFTFVYFLNPRLLPLCFVGGGV